MGWFFRTIGKGAKGQLIHCYFFIDGSPYTEADNWDRIHPALQTLSQKMWSGARPDQPWADFAALADGISEPEGVKSTHVKKLAK